MITDLYFDQISPDALLAASSRYDQHISPDLLELDKQRYEVLPNILAERQAQHSKQNGDVPCLHKDELVTLMKWKLKHGTWRPRLLSLVESNPEELIQQTTASAFGEALSGGLGPENDQVPNYVGAVNSATQTLIKLKGVGMATASLIMSVWKPADVPFFSDEFACWPLFGPEKGRSASSSNEITTKKPHPAWKATLKYSRVEYLNLAERVRLQRLKHHYAISCIDMEKAAWVICHEDCQLAEQVKSNDQQGEHDTAKTKQDQGPKKRKAMGSGEKPEGTRPKRTRSSSKKT